MIFRVCLTGLLLAFLLGQGGSALAQDAKESSASATESIPLPPVPDDLLGRGSPRGATVGYIKAAEEPDFEKAAQYLDTRNLPPEVASISAPELARQLHHVISRSVWLDDYSISDSPEGAAGDGLPAYRDLMVNVQLPDGEIEPIWLQRVPRGDDVSIWKVSNRTVARIPTLYAQFSYPPFVERIRGWFPDNLLFLGLEAFKWFIMIVAALLAWPVLHLAGWLLSLVFSSRNNENFPLVKKVFTGPLTAIAILVLLGALVDKLGAGVQARAIMETNTLVTIAIVWAIWTILTLARKHKQDKLIEDGRPGAAKLLRPLTLLVKLILVIMAAVFWAHNAGINVTTVLAGLGVGGLAVALALQKPLEDMMGALTIFTQAPIRVGDLCRFAGQTGTIEDIGLRTTRMRTLTNSVISIPNSRLAYMELENLTYREKIRYWPTLRLRYDTGSDQIHQICNEITALLEADPDVHNDGVRARLTDFGEDALHVKVHGFMKATDFADSLIIRERLNHGVMKIVRDAGAEFALPGRSLYMEGDKPTSPDQTSQ